MEKTKNLMGLVQWQKGLSQSINQSINQLVGRSVDRSINQFYGNTTSLAHLLLRFRMPDNKL